MEVEMVPNGPPDEHGVTPMTQNISFEVTATAKGHRREDGLTAAQVRTEIRERELNGS